MPKVTSMFFSPPDSGCARTRHSVQPQRRSEITHDHRTSALGVNQCHQSETRWPQPQELLWGHRGDGNRHSPWGHSEMGPYVPEPEWHASHEVSPVGDGNTTVHCTTFHYATLHYAALHYAALHYTMLHCTILHYAMQHYTMLHYTATLHYAALQYTTQHYVALHYAALHYATIHRTTLCYATLCYTILHYSTLCYITLHHTTLCYTTLYYTTLHYIAQVFSAWSSLRALVSLLVIRKDRGFSPKLCSDLIRGVT